MMAEENIRVRFNGRELIWLKGDDGSGPLAPLEHIDDDGSVKLIDAFFLIPTRTYIRPVRSRDMVKSSGQLMIWNFFLGR